MNNRVTAGLLIAAAFGVSACQKEATGQSVAVVNGEEVSQGELNAELQAANVPESADKKAVMPQLLQRVVDRRLVAQRAIDQGVDRSPEFISRERRMRENLLIGLYAQRQADTIKAPSQQEIQQFMAENPGMFAGREILALQQIAFQRPSDLNLLRQLQNDKTLDALAASLTRLGMPFQRNNGQLDTAQVPAPVLAQIRALPAGEPFVVPAGNRFVASVIIGRQAAVLPPQTAQRVAVEAIRRKKLGEMMDKQLKELKSAAKVEYQPGFEPKDTKAGATPAAPGAAAPATKG